MVKHSLIGISPLSGVGCSPSTVVANHPVAVLVIVSLSRFLRTPVNLSDDDRLGSDNRHRLTE